MTTETPEQKPFTAPGKPKAAEKWDELDPGFVRRTYRSSAVITGFTALFLSVRGLEWAVLPVVAGAALGLGLIWLNDTGFGMLFSPMGEETVGLNAGAKKIARAKRLQKISWIALVKYLLVGAVVALAVRFWSVAQVAAFAGGFCLIHMGITLRVISRMILARLNETSK